MEKNNGRLIMFDMDGTLYNFKEGSFNKSELRKKILNNAKLYIAKSLNKSKKEAKNILEYIEKKYGEDISIALEKEFGIDKNNYFNIVWNIPTKGIVAKNSRLRKFLLELKMKYRCAIVSDAPIVWINNVLKELNIKDVFKNTVYPGEGKIRKKFGNSFQFVANELMFNPKNCIVVGDQENTDIVQAKKNGMTAILISDRKKPTKADYIINDIFELKNFLKL